MKITEANLRPMVNELLDAFPVFDQWFSNLDDRQRAGMINAWARQVGVLHQSDVRAVMDRILDGRVPLPKNYEFDRLGFELRTWGGVEAASRIEREKASALKEQAAPNADPTVKGINARFGPAIKCAAAWGTAYRAGLVSEHENNAAMATIHEYHRQGGVELPWPQVPESERRSMVEFWRAER